MTEIILFHHVQGLTDGVVAFADRLRSAGHTVHTPDLFESRLFDTIDEGSAYREEVGFEELTRRAYAACADLPADVVYAGMSMGVAPAQIMLQANAEARGGLFLFGFIDPSYLDDPWPSGIPAQVHGMAGDPFMAEGDWEAAEAIAAQHANLEIFRYPGTAHLFADTSSPDHDEAATAQLLERAEAFLARL